MDTQRETERERVSGWGMGRGYLLVLYDLKSSLLCWVWRQFECGADLWASCLPRLCWWGQRGVLGRVSMSRGNRVKICTNLRALCPVSCAVLYLSAESPAVSLFESEREYEFQ